MLEAQRVALTYGDTVALAEASVTVSTGEIVAITGTSGSGKTSLLYCLSGLVRPTEGKVFLDGADLGERDNEALAELRRSTFGFVFQFAELVPELTLRENVALPLDLLRAGTRRSRRDRVREVLARLGLQEHADRRPGQVSGGQAQRAAVARALVHRPRLIFADEPTGSLDTRNGELVLQCLLEVSRESGSSVVLVTHDAKVAGAADREIAFADGRIVRP